MKILIGIALLIGVAMFLPLPVNSAAMQSLEAGEVRLGLALFACVAFLWMSEALPLAITALLVPVLGALMGVTTMKDALANFAAPPIFLFFGGFVLAAALSAQELDTWLAEKVSRLGRNRFYPVCYWIFAVTAGLSMWMSNSATTAMMIPIGMGVLATFRGKVYHVNHGIFLLLGIAYSASIGGVGTLVGSPPNGIAAKELGISFAEWIQFGVPTVLVLLPVMVWVLWLVLRPENLLASARDETVVENFKFTRPRVLTLVIFIATALGWIFGKPIGKAFTLSDVDTWVVLLAVGMLVGCRVIDWSKIHRDVEWGILFLFGGGLALSEILGDTGGSLFLARILASGMEVWPLWAVIAGIVCFVIFLTELTSNTACAALLVPVLSVMAAELELPATSLILPLAVAASCAFMLPVGTPPNAMVYATGVIPQRTMMKVGLVLNIVFILMITLLALWLA